MALNLSFRMTRLPIILRAIHVATLRKNLPVKFPVLFSIMKLNKSNIAAFSTKHTKEVRKDEKKLSDEEEDDVIVGNNMKLLDSQIGKLLSLLGIRVYVPKSPLGKDKKDDEQSEYEDDSIKSSFRGKSAKKSSSVPDSDPDPHSNSDGVPPNKNKPQKIPNWLLLAITSASILYFLSAPDSQMQSAFGMTETRGNCFFNELIGFESFQKKTVNCLNPSTCILVVNKKVPRRISPKTFLKTFF